MSKKLCINIFLFLFVSFLSSCISEAVAEQSPNEIKKVTKVSVKGNSRISTSTILSKVKTKEGMPFLQEVVSADIERLYKLGHFQDITVDASEFLGGLNIAFIVQERPAIEKVVISGNKKLKSKKIKRHMSIVVGDTYNKKRLKKNEKSIYELYKKHGYYAAVVSHTVEEKKADKVVVNIRIKEGNKVRIKGIIFDGNSHFSIWKLKRQMRTKKARLKWFPRGYYDPDKLKEDIKLLKLYYDKAGYIKAEIKEADITFNEAKTGMYIRISISENDKYFTSNITVKGNKNFSSQEIISILDMKNGNVFSEYGVSKDIYNIRMFYGERGYIEAYASREIQINDKDKTVDVVFNIDERSINYVRSIIIKGNLETKDKVIRREIRIKPGEKFDTKKVKRSREKLMNLGYFHKVNFSDEKTEEVNTRDLICDVKEKKTGSFSFGGGYSTVENAIGFIELRQKNFDIKNFPSFSGGGQYASVRADISARRQNFVLSFTEPWFRDEPLSLGFDLYNKTYYQEEWTETKTGGDIRVGRDLSEYTRGFVTYKCENVDVGSLTDDAPDVVQDDEGSATISSITAKIKNDHRDNIFDPTEGYVNVVSAECAGGPFFGDKDFYKLTGSTSKYFPLTKKSVFNVRFRAGVVDSYGGTKQVPVYERFYVGGPSTVRGYDYSSIGPEEDDVNVGGNSMLVGNLEYSYLLVDTTDTPTKSPMKIRGLLFYDAGNAWKNAGGFSSSMKTSIGTGIRILMPIPVTLLYGYGIDRHKGRFDISISYSF
ncbi:outer membrane protein assembly factor BamA [bacterium]|nr:outer membrane protein assembly factor BamA [bacterium]